MRSVRRVTRGRCKVAFLIPIIVIGYTVGIGVTQFFFTAAVLRPNIKTSRFSHEYFSREDSSIRCNCTGHNLAQATRTLAYQDVQKHTTIEYDQFEISNEIIKVNGTFYFPYFGTDYKIGEKAIEEWISRKQSHCQDHFVGYANAFASLRNIMIDPSKGSGNKGGENISLVMKQSENLEYLKLSKGYFTLVNVSHCDEVLKYSFAPRSHVNMWMKSVILDHSNFSSMSNDSVPQVTIAIQRYEYANLFFVMNDLYNVFLMMMVFHIQPSDVTILLIDGHPYGSLDHLWNGLFHDVIRAGHLPRRTRFERLIWALPGYNSFFMKSNTKAPYLEAYRNFVINGLRVKDTHKLNCNRLSVLFIWRHDYVAHPRNPKGQISRKIKNEEELINTLIEKFPNYTIRGNPTGLVFVSGSITIYIHDGYPYRHARCWIKSHSIFAKTCRTYWAVSKICFKLFTFQIYDFMERFAL